MTRTMILKAPHMERAAQSAILDMIDEDMATGPAHGRELCAASLARRAWDGQAEGVSGLLIRDSLTPDGPAHVARTLDKARALTDAAIARWEARS